MGEKLSEASLPGGRYFTRVSGLSLRQVRGAGADITPGKTNESDEQFYILYKATDIELYIYHTWFIAGQRRADH